MATREAVGASVQKRPSTLAASLKQGEQDARALRRKGHAAVDKEEFLSVRTHVGCSSSPLRLSAFGSTNSTKLQGASASLSARGPRRAVEAQTVSSSRTSKNELWLPNGAWMQ